VNSRETGTSPTTDIRSIVVEVLNNNHRELLNYARKRLGWLAYAHASEPDDLVQDAVVIILKTVSVPRSPDDVLRIMRSIIKRRSQDLHRKVARFSWFGSDMLDIAGSGSRNSLEQVELLQLTNAVDHALAGMPTKMRIACRLHFIDGLSETEVAAQLGRSVHTIRTHLSRGRWRFREQLARFRPTG
jgi:RNA polymerase sigma factor (sigma-70 family)